MKMTLPILDCKSTQLAPTLSKLTLKAKNGQWGAFGRGVFTTHGETNFSDLIDGANIAKSLSADSEFLIKANADEKELVLHAFKKGGGNMGATGSVSFQFKRMGVFRIKPEHVEDAEMLGCA